MNAVMVATLGLQNFPHDTVFGAVVFKLLDANGVVVSTQSVPAGQTDTSASATFTSVNPGTYTASAERQDGGGAPLAPAVVSAPFTVADTSPVTISVPSSVSVSLSG